MANESQVEFVPESERLVPAQLDQPDSNWERVPAGEVIQRPPPNDSKLEEFFRAEFESASSASEASTPTPESVLPPFVKRLDQAFAASFERTSGGLLLRQKLPTTEPPQDPSLGEGVAAAVGSLVGDAPAMSIGYLSAGGAWSPTLGIAGGYTLPAALRTALTESYKDGSASTLRDLWPRVVRAATKAWITGAGTAVTGGVVGAAGAPLAVQLASEVAAMTTIGAKLEHQVPTWEELATNAALVFGLKGIGVGIEKLTALYNEKGIRPQDAARDSAQDPSVAQDLASRNLEVPRVYETPEARAERLDAKIAEVRKTAEQVAPEALIGKETLDTPEGRILSRIAIGGQQAKEGFSFAKQYQNWVDALSPIKAAVDAMADGKSIPAIADAYKLARMRVAAAAKAQHMLEYGTFDADGRINGESFQEIVRPLSDKADAFRTYLVAKRSEELSGRGIETGIDPADARAAVASGEAAFESYRVRLFDFQKRVLDYYRSSGMLNQEQYDTMLEANKDYTPFYRVLADEKAGGPSSGAPANLFQALKRIKGSEAEIVDPLESIVKNTHTLTQLAERNKVGIAYTDLIESSGKSEYGEIAKSKATPTTLSEAERRSLVEKVLDGQELTARQETNLAEDFSIFRRNPLEAGKNQIAVFRDGKREVWNVPADVYEAFASGGPQEANVLIQWLSKPARTLRAGSVLTPEFMGRNIVRDPFSAFIYSASGYKPFLDTVRGLMHVVRKDGVYQEWLRSGGPVSALQSLDRDYLQQNLRGLMEETNLRSAPLNALRHPVETLRAFSELTENSTRVGEFAKARAAGESLTEAGFRSREVTLDFARMGLRGRQMNMITAFWNAQIQGGDKLVRAFKERPIQTAAKITASITLPSVVLHVAFKDHPAIRDAPQWQKDLFWLIPLGDGADATVLRIPKPFEVGVIFGSGMERVADWILYHDPKAFDGFMQTLERGAAPGFVPTAAAPLVEMYSNRSLFLDRPLIPRDMETMLPEDQYQPYTTELGKAVGKALSTLPGMKYSWWSSPIVIENWVRGMTGGLGVHLLDVADLSLRKSGILPDPPRPADTFADMPFLRAFIMRNPSMGMKPVQDFWDRVQQEQTLFDTVQGLAARGETAKALQQLGEMGSIALRTQALTQSMSATSHLIRLAYQDPNSTPEEKRQIIDNLTIMYVQQARYGNNLLDMIEKAREGAAAMQEQITPPAPDQTAPAPEPRPTPPRSYVPLPTPAGSGRPPTLH